MPQAGRIPFKITVSFKYTANFGRQHKVFSLFIEQKVAQTPLT
jgi:hypothetical protein